MGRTNKLVDGCYSYWHGALFPLLQQLWPLYVQQLGLPHAPQPESAPLPDAAMESFSLPPLAAQAPAEQADAEAKRLRVRSVPLRRRACMRCAPLRDATHSGRMNVWCTVQDMADVPVRHPQQPDVSAVDARLAAQRAAEQSEALRVRGAVGYLQLSLLIAQANVEPPSWGAHAQHSAATLCPVPASDGPSTANRSSTPTSGSDDASESAPPLYNARALRLWLLKCCQAGRGGLRDKPGKPVDYYHTCYCLSGHAACQAYAGVHSGDEQLATIDPACNVVASKLAEALAFFRVSDLPA